MGEHTNMADAMKKQAQEGMVDSVVNKGMDMAGPVIEKLKPVIAAGKELITTVGPYVEQAHDAGEKLYTKLEPYHPEEFVPIILGFILCFFGGAFCTTIAAVEAFRMCGYSRSSKAFNMLKEQYKAAADAMEKDNDVDADGDGKKDVDGLDNKQLFARKMKIALKTCDPEDLSDGFQGLYAGFLAVVATLQIRFARVLTLGNSLGDGIHRLVHGLEPQLEEAASPEFKKWVPKVVRYVCKSVGVMLAWMVQRVIFGFTSAMKGGQMIVRGAGSYLVRNGHLSEEYSNQDSPTFKYIEFMVCGIGFWSQFQRGFGLGYFAIFLFPCTMVEYTLGLLLGSVA